MSRILPATLLLAALWPSAGCSETPGAAAVPPLAPVVTSGDTMTIAQEWTTEARTLRLADVGGGHEAARLTCDGTTLRLSIPDARPGGSSLTMALGDMRASLGAVAANGGVEASGPVDAGFLTALVARQDLHVRYGPQNFRFPAPDPEVAKRFVAACRS